MKYLLDTNICINMMRTGRGESIRRRLEDLEDGDAVICSIVRQELVFGALRSRDVAAGMALVNNVVVSSFSSLPFDDAAADYAANIRSRLFARGTPIGPHDLQIAAIAAANKLTLVTANVSEFTRVEGLTVESW